MSGGVDSSVAAWLLQREGWDCAGATMRLYDGEAAGGDNRTCCSLDDVEDAKSVSRRLGIPHYVCNFGREFDRHVMAPFADSYQAGLTPNPCIDCNRHLKFGRLLDWAAELGYDYVATGHYARLGRDGDRLFLQKAADLSRDQSYVLATALTQERMARTLFPLGGLTKPQVRQIAEEQGFINARKRDSQDICFVPDGDYGAFLERYTGKTYPPGDILDQSGRTVGRHKGLVRYTLGQRKGLGIAADAPVYVCGKSVEANTLTVGPDEALYSRALLAEDWVWGAGCPPSSPVTGIAAKVRYRQTEQPAQAEILSGGRIKITFDQPQRAVTPGQTAVLYQGDAVLGGGVIAQVLAE
ncbi:MAG: tRNA 2-thiouridine(34) synthase MnmA [Oscillibacter sp.]|nr:tRNA 2-thiouridine(34) synthase MnmA [Oscillibacter sp.]